MNTFLIVLRIKCASCKSAHALNFHKVQENDFKIVIAADVVHGKFY